MQEFLDREQLKLGQHLRQEIKARKAGEKTINDSLAAAAAAAAADLAAMAGKTDAGLGRLRERCERLEGAQQRSQEAQAVLAADCSALRQVRVRAGVVCHVESCAGCALLPWQRQFSRRDVCHHGIMLTWALYSHGHCRLRAASCVVSCPCRHTRRSSTRCRTSPQHSLPAFHRSLTSCGSGTRQQQQRRPVMQLRPEPRWRSCASGLMQTRYVVCCLVGFSEGRRWAATPALSPAVAGERAVAGVSA